MTEARPLGVPVVAPSTGASTFFDQPDPLLFVVRAKYQSEIAELVHYFDTLGLRRLALVNVNDTFGKDTEIGFNNATKKLSADAHSIFTVDRLKPDIAKATADVGKFAPQAVILACPSTTARAMIDRSCSSAMFVPSVNPSCVSLMETWLRRRSDAIRSSSSM